MKKIRLFTLAAALVCLAAWQEVFAQHIPVSTKFGDVSDEELEMTVYPPDTSAAVVILYRHKEVEATLSATRGLTRRAIFTERVKILKESGKDFPNYKIHYSVKSDPRETVGVIKVWTHNLVDGKRVVDKLPKKMIFNEKVSDSEWAVSFSAQNVRVGSVVEVTYTFESPYVADIGTIFLQTTYPINYSEATVSFAEWFYFTRMQRGFVPCQHTSETSNDKLLYSNGVSIPYLRRTDHYVAYDVPALKDASLCFCPEQFMLGVDYDLHSFNIPGEYSENFSSSWENVDKKFRDNGIVKEFYSKSRFRDEVGSILSSTTDEKEQICKIRDVVTSTVRWDGYRSIKPNASDAWKKKEGSSADINALMGSALNEAGFKADPVFIRTRDHGLLMDFHVKLDAFNSVVLRVTCPSGAVYYIDASWDHGYLNVLPVQYMVARGRVVPLEGEGSWAALNRLARNQERMSVQMDIQPDGTVRGHSVNSGTNAVAAYMKQRVKEIGDKDKEKLISFLENRDGVEIEEVSTDWTSEWGPSARISYSWKDEATVSGDLVYIKPFTTKFHSQNDFKRPDRVIPVEFPFPEMLSYSLSMNIPEGYIIESMPETQVLQCPCAQSSAQLQVMYNGEDKISMNYRFILGETFIAGTDYAELRSYWEKVCGLYDSTIVLKKK